MKFYPTPLFQDISYDCYKTIRTCLSAYEAAFHAGEIICDFGVPNQPVGILADGAASIIRFESNGFRTILYPLKPHDVFGELLLFQSARNESICVVCQEDCTVLFLDYNRILTPCAKTCLAHQQLIRNMLQVISNKAIRLSRRLEVLTKRTIREKLLCYFLHMSQETNSESFCLSFSLMDLADYLSVDRSAMSRELKKLKNDGLISISNKNVCILSMEKLLNLLV